jgi:hypothetical protein
MLCVNIRRELDSVARVGLSAQLQSQSGFEDYVVCASWIVNNHVKLVKSPCQLMYKNSGLSLFGLWGRIIR